jgi:hypothetical protein
MSVALMRVRIREENDKEVREVFLYANEDGLQLSPEFKSVKEARLWYSDIMKDYPY